jgi:arsenic resistance protein ArsH
MGAMVEILNPSDLPLPDDAPESQLNVTGVRSLVRWLKHGKSSRKKNE